MENNIIKTLYWFIIILIGITGIVLLFVRNNENEYNKALENPPTIYYIEEDAEYYLMSTLLEVVEIDDSNVDYIIYIIYDADTENYYRVSYKLEKHYNMFSPTYEWVYNSSIYLGKDYDNNNRNKNYL